MLKRLLKPVKLKGQKMLRPLSKHSFVIQLKPNCELLDVGCGNNSPAMIKSVLPACRYTGIDVCEPDPTRPNAADQYIVASPETFAAEIAKLTQRFDAVISSHNLEHCNQRFETLRAMLEALKPGGQIYLSFPCEASVDFPKRQGTLNYYDDVTHRDLPPGFHDVVASMKRHGFEIDAVTERHRPPVDWMVGRLNERRSRRQARVLRGTWEYYGFETIIWARRSKSMS